MSSVGKYIADLTNLKNNFDEVVRGIVLKHEGKLLATVKLRLFQRSLDADYNSLGIYSTFTQKQKKRKGQISNRVTLRDTGTWYGSMFIDFVNKEIVVESTDYPKTDELMDIYGEAILGLTESEVEDFVDTVLDPEIQRILNLNNEIDFGEL